MPESHASSPIVVGFDGSAGAFDAVALARLLSDLSDDPLVVAAISVADLSLASELAGLDLEPALQRRGDEELESAEASLGGLESWRGEALVGVSPAQGLQRLAEMESAELVVVGASHRRHPAGLLGSTATRLLHGAPCSVAIAGRGWSERGGGGLRDIGVGFDGSPESRIALATGAALARSSGATLHALAVFAPPNPANPMFAVTNHGYKEIVTSMRGYLESELGDAVAAVSQGLRVEVEVVDGSPAEVLTGRSASFDLLVLGSRGYGPIRAVMAGSVSARVAADAACSLILVPRGVVRAFPCDRERAPGAGVGS